MTDDGETGGGAETAGVGTTIAGTASTRGAGGIARIEEVAGRKGGDGKSAMDNSGREGTVMLSSIS